MSVLAIGEVPRVGGWTVHGNFESGYERAGELTMKTGPLAVVWLAAVILGFGCSGSPESGPAQAEPRVFRGEYSYFADASSFIDCQDGTRYAVTGPENPTLERAYLKAASWPADSILIEVEGRLEPRPAMEGDKSETTLVVSRVVDVDGNAWCVRGSNAGVVGTYSVGSSSTSSSERHISLTLQEKPLLAVLTTDPMNGKAPVVESGTWSREGADRVRLIMEPADDLETGEELVFFVGRHGDLLYEGERYAPEGLKLKKDG
jgi:copper homeostasis protein (lipoprotein)